MRYLCIWIAIMMCVIVCPAKGGLSTITMNATAYTGHGRSVSGNPVRRGVIAADPRVLPLGTKVRLTNAGQYSGVYRVEDTGGKIHGRNLDVYMPSRRAAREFGRRTVKVEVLTPKKGHRKSDVSLRSATAAHHQR